MKSIFDLENRLDIKKEFSKFVKVFHEDKYATEVYQERYWSDMTFLSAVNEKVFWVIVRQECDKQSHKCITKRCKGPEPSKGVFCFMTICGYHNIYKR